MADRIKWTQEYTDFLRNCWENNMSPEDIEVCLFETFGLVCTTSTIIAIVRRLRFHRSKKRAWSMIWTPEKINFLRSTYPYFTKPMADYVDMFNKNFGVNFSVCSIRSACSAYHVGKTKKRVIWTEDMDKYLIENYPGFTKSVDDFLVLFNSKFHICINKHTLANRVSKLNIKKPRVSRVWTSELLQVLQENYSKFQGCKQIANFLNKTYGTNFSEQAVSSQAKKMNLVRFQYSEELYSYIKETYPNYKGSISEYVEEVSKKFNIHFTRGILLYICGKLGVRSASKSVWTPEQDKTLLELWGSLDKNCGAIAEEMEKIYKIPYTKSAIGMRSWRLGLDRPPKWTKEMIMYFLKEYPNFTGTNKAFAKKMSTKFNYDVTEHAIAGRAQMYDIKKSGIFWGNDKLEYIQKLYDAGLTRSEIVKLVRDKYNLSHSYSSISSVISKITRGYVPHVVLSEKEMTPELRKVAYKKGKNKYELLKAQYNYIMAGNQLEKNQQFIYKDNNRENCNVDNLIAVDASIRHAYDNVRRQLPKNDATLNEDVYKRLFLEKEVKRILGEEIK